MPRAIWTGILQFVLISFPVKMYKAVDSKGISFKTLHSVCGNGIKYKKWCETCGREIQPDEMDKGYEIAKNQFVVFKEDEIDNMLPESSKIIMIEKAVPADEIPLITYEENYFLVPDKGGDHVYNLLFNALSIKPKVLIGRVVMRNKEHIVAIRPYIDGLLLSLLHFADEVRDIHEVFVLKEKQVDKKELDLTSSLLDYLTGSFKDINQIDSFREQIDKIAEMRSKGQVITIQEKKPVVTVAGLVDALKQSIDISKAGMVDKKPELVIEAKKGKSDVVLPIKQQLDKVYGVAEQEINEIILKEAIENTQERINTLKELMVYKSFEEYVKGHAKEFEGFEISPDYKLITILDETYPRINIPILKKIGIVAEHFGVMIYIKSSKKQVAVVHKVKEEEILRLF